MPRAPPGQRQHLRERVGRGPDLHDKPAFCTGARRAPGFVVGRRRRATLAAAAVFRPVLRRTQAMVDRRFNRERYDAQRVVDAFDARLQGESDPDATAADLLAAVGRALQPTAGRWTRGPS